MGWMSWSKYYCEVDCGRHPRNCINEQLYKDMADRIAEDGYLQAGYEYVHVDDCWMARSRSSDGRLAANATRFPSGISGLASYVHGRGLKLGLYASVGPKTCEGYPGSYGHYQVDAQTFANWNVDYLKVDGCHLQTMQQAGAFMEMSRYVSHAGRQIAYACGWPVYYLAAGQANKINYTSVAQHCNSWRNYYDMTRKSRTMRKL
ncbi:Melibiase family protein [Aphelenchoides avenae]|nr:Melibiase family protein [Aphelenchus avenae]